MPVLIALVVVAIIATLVLFALRRKEEKASKYDGPVRVVDVDLIGGWLVVEPSGDGATHVSRSSQWLLKRPKTSEDLTSGTLTLRAAGSPLLSGVTGYIVKAPAGATVRARTFSATVEVRGTTGGAEVETVSGGVTLDAIVGGVTVKSDVGEVTGIALTCALVNVNCRAAAVDLNFTIAPSIVEIEAQDGAVRVALPAGAYEIDASSEAGDVEVTVEATPGAPNRIAVKSTNGNVTVEPT